MYSHSGCKCTVVLAAKLISLILYKLYCFVLYCCLRMPTSTIQEMKFQTYVKKYNLYQSPKAFTKLCDKTVDLKCIQLIQLRLSFQKRKL